MSRAGPALIYQSFRRQLHTAISTEFPQIPLPDRRHVPPHEASGASRAAQNGGVSTAQIKVAEQQNGLEPIKTENEASYVNGSHAA